MADGDKPSNKVERNRKERRTKIQVAIEQAEEEKRRELFRRRLDVASKGLKDYKEQRMPEAVRQFEMYLKILEQWKGVRPGNLTPANFDKKKEAAELLLISGVYWDLAKLYDRTKSADRRRDFQTYLNKYVEFTLGMPFQKLGTESLRKYISTDRPRHKDAFKAAYRALGGDSKCFVATALMDVSDPATLPRLRRFRDEVLMGSVTGRVFVRWYYRNGPIIARMTDRLPWMARRLIGAIIDGLARKLSRVNHRSSR